MAKNLYRVAKKSDLDEIIKNNFLKPICIIFTTKETNKDFEDNIATLFKNLSKQNTYCMYLLINLDNFIDNINFFGEMRLNSPNFITYFKGRQISSFTNIQNNKELFISTINDITNKINSSYIQKLAMSFNQEDTDKNTDKNSEKNTNLNKENKEDKENEEDDENDDDENDENDDDDEVDDDNEEDNENNEDKTVNNIKKRNIDISSEKKKEDNSDKVDISKVDISKVNLSKVDLSKVDISKVDIRKVDLSKVDLSKIDLEQLSIDKKKEKLKELLELKKRAQKN